MPSTFERGLDWEKICGGGWQIEHINKALVAPVLHEEEWAKRPKRREPKKAPAHTAKKRPVLKVIATNMRISPTAVSTKASEARGISNLQFHPLRISHTTDRGPTGRRRGEESRE